MRSLPSIMHQLGGSCSMCRQSFLHWSIRVAFWLLMACGTAARTTSRFPVSAATGIDLNTSSRTNQISEVHVACAEKPTGLSRIGDFRLRARQKMYGYFVRSLQGSSCSLSKLVLSAYRIYGLRKRNAKPHACFQNVTRSITLIFPVINLPFSMGCYSRTRFIASPKLLSPDLDAEVGLL